MSALDTMGFEDNSKVIFLTSQRKHGLDPLFLTTQRKHGLDPKKNHLNKMILMSSHNISMQECWKIISVIPVTPLHLKH